MKIQTISQFLLGLLRPFKANTPIPQRIKQPVRYISNPLSKPFTIGLISMVVASCAHNHASSSHQSSPIDLNTNTVSLAPVEIEFARYWQRDRLRKHTKSELEDLRQRYQTSLQKALEKSLIKQGWTINPAAPAVATLKIEKMHIAAPDFDGTMSRLYAPYEFGHGHFFLSVTENGETVAIHDDYLTATGGIPHKLTPTNRLLNTRAFSLALSRFIKAAQKNVE